MRMNRRPTVKRVIKILPLLLSATSALAQDPPPTADPAMQSPPQQAPVVPPGGATGAPSSVLSGFMEPFEYKPEGRKDPFSVPSVEKPLPPGSFHGPTLPLQKFRLDELALTGIIWDVVRPRAMLRDPTGKIHVVGLNAKLGNQNGYVAVIREGEIVVIETFEEEGKLFSAARVVKLASAAAKVGEPTKQ